MEPCPDRVADRVADEIDRLLALDSYAILDTPEEQPFADLTELAAHVCATPMALVGFIDADRQWIKARYGIGVAEIPRERAFCTQVIDSPELLEVSDTWLDSRFSSHPMVIGEPHLRFYAGAPLITADGHVLGTLCVMDTAPRALSAVQRKHLHAVAAQVVTLLESRRQARQFALEVEARRAADAALRHQQRVLEGVLNHADVLIFAKDVDGRFVMSNRALERTTRVEGGLIGGTDHDFFDAEIADEYRRHDRHIMATREWQVFTEQLIHPDGSVHTYRSSKFPLMDDSGEVIGIGGVCTDVTELEAARAAHAKAEKRWRALVEQSPGAVMVIDGNGSLVYANPQAVAMVGAATMEEITAIPGLRLVPAAVRADVQAMLAAILAGGPAVRDRQGVLYRLDGTEFPVEFTAKAITYAGGQSVQIEVRDISALAAAHEALKQSASTDALTGLLNRGAWDERVASLLADPRYQGAPMTFAVIDLDNFKSYNDTHGHTAGDALLKGFATAAGEVLRYDDVLARWGGEEFVIAMPGTAPAEAHHVLNRLCRCVPSGQTCSIGYTVHKPSETLTDTVMRADAALYQAKRRGRNQLFLL